MCFTPQSAPQLPGQHELPGQHDCNQEAPIEVPKKRPKDKWKIG
jgi:hypothetical protein